MADEVLYELRDKVAVVTINRPEKLNAINTTVRAGLRDAWARFDKDPTARVAVLTGSGDRAFCVGMDLVEMSEMGLQVPPPDFIPVLGQSVSVTKPVIAAVNGIAYAGGWLFAQMCDLCVASENATFAISEAKVGRGAPWAAPLIHMVPQRIMLQVLLTGDPITAQRAYEIGLVNQVVPKEELLPASLELAGKIADNAPLTVEASKRMAYLSTEMGRTAALDAANAVFEKVYTSEDAQEGPRAFREKRKPNWQGK
jgi:enoyl-CoA hydratase